MGFERDTYICLDLPEPIADQVLEVRARYDPFCAALPAEITVAGSSGVGTIEPGQSELNVWEIIERIAETTSPIKARFGPVGRFPRTDIFFLTLENRQVFDALHQRIAASRIRFRPIPYPYTPHCTLTTQLPSTAEEIERLMSLQIPEAFCLTTVSVYSLAGSSDLPNLELLHRAQLRLVES